MFHDQEQVDSVDGRRVISGLGESLCISNELERVPLEGHIYARALDCVNCGLCLPSCPTYAENGMEADSPRGRIILMKGLADGRIKPTLPVLSHLDLCVQCRACETACPSGVIYHELIEQMQDRLEGKRAYTISQRLVRFISLHIFAYSIRLKLVLLPVRVLQHLGLWRLLTGGFLLRLLPRELQKMQQMLPEQGPLWPRVLSRHYGVDLKEGQRRLKVGFFTGCVGSVLFQDVNRQAISLLQEAGYEVVVPRKQECCGAIHLHNAGRAKSKLMAKKNIDVFLPAAYPCGKPCEEHLDYIVTVIAGCGAMLGEYDDLLNDDKAYSERASLFSSKVRDISELLADSALRPRYAINRTVTYHDACHLVHAQQVRDAPRQLLSRISGLKLVSLSESELCCGAGGAYNLLQPEMSVRLGRRKVENILATGASICLTGNVGCAMQIDSEARQMGVDLEVLHPITLLYEATFGKGVQKRG